ncbi:MAG: hypothetical protein AAF479_08980 [Pseudomonadota bacterium]
MLQRTKKMNRSTKGMEIVEAPQRTGRTEAKKDERRAAPEDSAFGIVETVTGPVAGTFGLSDVWDRN